MKYNPDIGSTKHRWSWLRTLVGNDAAQMHDAVADDDAEAVRTPVLHAERIDDAATKVIVVGCRIGGLAGKACDRYDTNLSKEN